MPEVKYRPREILKIHQIPFNSWFFNTDGVGGELYNDFLKAHKMTQVQDTKNCFERMRYAIEQEHLNNWNGRRL